MTAPDSPPPEICLVAADPYVGCTAKGCGVQATEQLGSCHGRRCSEHAVHELTEAAS